MKTIIIDDERHSTDALCAKLSMAAPEAIILATFQSPSTIDIAAFKQLEPDVVFIDIEMPIINGFQLLERLMPYKFEVVFVTAYHQYALRALRLSAFDYLLKPIDSEELQETINRLRKLPKKHIAETSQAEHLTLLTNTLKQLIGQQKENIEKIALCTQEGILFVCVKDIVRVEAMSNYSSFFMLSKQRVVVSRTLKEFEEVLPNEHFFRVNRSNLVNLSQVTKYQKGDGGVVFLSDGSEIEVSSQRKAALLEKLMVLNK